MTIIKSKSFEIELENIVLYIAKDSKTRALKFQKVLIQNLNQLSNMPKKFRKSIYYDDINLRDYIYKGYTIPYLINQQKNEIVILDIFKWSNH